MKSCVISSAVFCEFLSDLISASLYRNVDYGEFKTKKNKMGKQNTYNKILLSFST